MVKSAWTALTSGQKRLDQWSEKIAEDDRNALDQRSRLTFGQRSDAPPPVRPLKAAAAEQRAETAAKSGETAVFDRRVWPAVDRAAVLTRGQSCLPLSLSLGRPAR